MQMPAGTYIHGRKKMITQIIVVLGLTPMFLMFSCNTCTFSLLSQNYLIGYRFIRHYTCTFFFI